MERKPLILGAAYHGNRMPHHAREDMRDMMRNGMDLVVHMFSHTDWDRHKEKMREILSISEEVGLESWVDNWGPARRQIPLSLLPSGSPSGLLQWRYGPGACVSKQPGLPRLLPGVDRRRAFHRRPHHFLG